MQLGLHTRLQIVTCQRFNADIEQTTKLRHAHCLNVCCGAVTYFLTLIWLFFGVAIISDVFMGAIEQITSAEKVILRKTRSGKEHRITVQVWNPTVANLTLMALGSSAPEIMLAILETLLTLGKPAGELGPSTIVGAQLCCWCEHALHSGGALNVQQ